MAQIGLQELLGGRVTLTWDAHCLGDFADNLLRWLVGVYDKNGGIRHRIFPFGRPQIFPVGHPQNNATDRQEVRNVTSDEHGRAHRC